MSESPLTNSVEVAKRVEQVVIRGDCLEVMRGFADKSFDLVLTDPPYGIGADKNTRANKQHGNAAAPSKDYGVGDWDATPPSREFFDEMFRISKNQIIFGGNYFGLAASPCWIVWDKDNGTNGYADCELAWTSFNTAVRKVRHRWHGMLQENMGIHKETREHPTQKPLNVMAWCIANYSKEGATILDPFMGSGTTLVAAKQLGRLATGIEINPKYCEVARGRLLQEQLF